MTHQGTAPQRSVEDELKDADRDLHPLTTPAQAAIDDLTKAIRLSDEQGLSAIEVRQLAAQLAVRNVRA